MLDDVIKGRAQKIVGKNITPEYKLYCRCSAIKKRCKERLLSPLHHLLDLSLQLIQLAGLIQIDSCPDGNEQNED